MSLGLKLIMIFLREGQHYRTAFATQKLFVFNKEMRCIIDQQAMHYT